MESRIQRLAPPVTYFALLIAATATIVPWWMLISFLLYSALLLWIIKIRGPHHEHARLHIDFLPQKKTPALTTILLIVSFLFIATTRITPFLRWGPTPLGYDTGFYWYFFHLITPLGASYPTLVSGNIAYTFWFPFYFLGVPAVPTIHLLHVLNQLLTAGALYLLINSIYQNSKRAPLIAAIGVFLFSLSLNQFMAYWWMFNKLSAALPLLLAGLALFLRGSWLAVPVAAVGATIHLQTALPFAIAYFLFILYRIGRSLFKKEPFDRELLFITGSAVVVGVLILAFKTKTDIPGLLNTLLKVKGIATNTDPWNVQHLKGLFIPFFLMRINALFYLPFAIIGVLSIRAWSPGFLRTRAFFVPLLFVVLILMSSFPIIYQNRNLIPLDLMLIILAAYPVTRFLENLRERSGRYTATILIVGAILFGGRVIWDQQPQLYQREAQEIQAITRLHKPDEYYFMATSSIYTPWVFSYNNFRPTIAPGWLSWDRWNLDMWQEFWEGDNNERRNESLKIYEKPVYLFFGERQRIGKKLQEYLDTEPKIQKVSPHVWRFDPRESL